MLHYTYNGWKAYGAGDMFCLDSYVDYHFSGNVLEEVLKKLQLKVLTKDTAVVIEPKTGRCVACLYREELKSPFGLTWPGYDDF